MQSCGWELTPVVNNEVRCSSFPLVSHPLSAQWRSLAARCSSFDNFLDLMALPSDKPGVLLQSPFQTLEVQSGRRYQNPYNPACLALVILSTLIGILFSYILHPSIPNNASPLVLSVTCSFSLLAHLMLCCLDGNSHEINPMRYLNLDPTKIFSFHFKLPNMSSIIFAAVAIMAGPIWTSSLSMTTWKLMGTCLMVATLSSIYLIAVNHFAQICLCLPMQQISWLIEGITGDFTVESTLDVVLCSILFGNSDLIKSIWSPTQKPGTLMMEDAEVERNEKSMETMSTLLLQKEVFSFGSHLEQDMLLVLFMESFGGGTNENSKRQQSTIKKFVHPKEETLSMTNSGQGEPCAVPLVRALCAYAGGLGLALSSISSFGSKTISPSKYASSFVTWSLPHGAIASAQWAITGASRFMLESMFHSGKTMSSWRCNHVSILIPIVLHAAFALQDGILKYDKTRSQGLGDLISLDVLPVVVACDNAALLILGKLQSFESSQKVDFHVHSDCRVWLEALLSRENKVSSEITPMLEQEHEHFMRPQRMFAYQ